MTSAEPVARAARCPVCDSSGTRLLDLSGQAIYQHPVPPDADVDPPYVVNLSWIACSACAHAWQPQFDTQLLESIYRSHYYTPAPGGMALQFRNDFLACLEQFGVAGKKRVLLEIGASDGDVLAELRARTGASYAYAFEPNTENAEVARRRGLDVRERFFGADVRSEGLDAAELVYARHVIEHIFQFDDFFRGLYAAAAPDADLVLETPSLDFHAREGSIATFHIEHIHVFCLRSIATVARRHGWGLTQSLVTPDGNLIAAFKKGGAQPQIARPVLVGLQNAVDERQRQWRDLTQRRTLVFWGAGSSGVALAGILGREPEFWTDGNPNKIGRKFVGLKSLIVDPSDAITVAQRSANGNPLLIIASTFAREILPRVRELGWTGEVRDMNMAVC